MDDDADVIPDEVLEAWENELDDYLGAWADELRERLPKATEGAAKQGHPVILAHTITVDSSRKAPADATLLHRLAARLEPQMRAAFLAAVRGAAGTIDLGALAVAVGSGTPSRVEAAALIGQLSADLRRRLLPVIGRSFALGVALGAEVAELDPKLTYGFDLKNPASIQWAREHAAELVTEVMDSTRSGLRALVTASQTEGISPFDLAQEIREVVGLHSRQITAVANFRDRLLGRDVSPAEVRRRVAAYADAQLEWRAMNIARTETLTASAEGQEQLWQRAAEAGHLDPTDTARVWVVTKDDRLDEEVCEPLDGVEAALGEPFVHPDTEDEYPRPPAHPQCRCAVVLRFGAAPKQAHVTKYSDDQPRDESGRWSSGGSTAPTAAEAGES